MLWRAEARSRSAAAKLGPPQGGVVPCSFLVESRRGVAIDRLGPVQFLDGAFDRALAISLGAVPLGDRDAGARLEDDHLDQLLAKPFLFG